MNYLSDALRPRLRQIEIGRAVSRDGGKIDYNVEHQFQEWRAACCSASVASIGFTYEPAPCAIGKTDLRSAIDHYRRTVTLEDLIRTASRRGIHE